MTQMNAEKGKDKGKANSLFCESRVKTALPLLPNPSSADNVVVAQSSLCVLCGLCVETLLTR
jgi:hypothetical protein